MTSKTYHNGKWHSGNYKMLGAEENGSWIGMIVFDGARSFDGVQPDLDLHCMRSIRSAEVLALNPGKDWQEIYDIIQDGIKKFKKGTHLYLRINFWDGSTIRKLLSDQAEFSVVLTEIDLTTNGFSANISAHFVKPGPKQAPTGAKASCLYPNNLLAIFEAQKEGFDNCVMLDPYGTVAEFTMSNIFYVKNNNVYTPKPNNTFLNGITRQRVIKLLRADGYDVIEKSIFLEELETADEIFSTGNINKVQAVTKFMDKELGEGVITRRAWSLYMDFAHK